MQTPSPSVSPKQLLQSSGFGLAIGLIAGILAALFLAWQAGLEGQRHAHLTAMMLTIIAASSGGHYALRAFQEPAKALAFALRGIGLSLGLALAALAGIAGAGVAMLGWSVLWLLLTTISGALIALPFYRLASRPNQWGSAAAALFGVAIATTPFWTDGLVTNNMQSYSAIGPWVVGTSPPLLMLESGLRIEVFSGYLYMEDGFILKDLGPMEFYSAGPRFLYLALVFSLFALSLRKVFVLMKNRLSSRHERAIEKVLKHG